MADHQSRDKEQAAILELVASSLKALKTLPREESFQRGVDDDTITLPIDGMAPPTYDVRSYVSKIMEYVECFLIANRLAKALKYPGTILPARLGVRSLIDAILETVNATADAIGASARASRAADTGPRYEPFPHISTSIGVPMVDFAGFLTVVLFDYLAWESAGAKDTATAAEAKREIHDAASFLLDERTFIEDELGTGWSFVPRTLCEKHTRYDKMGVHRHILPTAWALVALQRYVRWPEAEKRLVKKIETLMPATLDWVSGLANETGLFSASEADRRPTLAGHNYVTEALVTLAELDLDGARELVPVALRRFSDELAREGAQDEFEFDLWYTLPQEGSRTLAYADRTTWATCLATLSSGIALLDREASAEEEPLKSEIREHCQRMAQHVIVERRAENGLWQRGSFAFNWTLNAVEALLRFALYAKPEEIVTSADAVTRAVGVALASPRVTAAIREALVGELRRAGEIQQKYAADDDAALSSPVRTDDETPEEMK